jgi:hypothetical protein
MSGQSHHLPHPKNGTDYFTLRPLFHHGRDTCTHWLRDCVGCASCTDVVANRKIPCPVGRRKLAVQTIASLLLWFSYAGALSKNIINEQIPSLHLIYQDKGLTLEIPLCFKNQYVVITRLHKHSLTCRVMHAARTGCDCPKILIRLEYAEVKRILWNIERHLEIYLWTRYDLQRNTKLNFAGY